MRDHDDRPASASIGAHGPYKIVLPQQRQGDDNSPPYITPKIEIESMDSRRQIAAKELILIEIVKGFCSRYVSILDSNFH